MPSNLGSNQRHKLRLKQADNQTVYLSTLELCNTPRCKLQLQGHSPSESLYKTWQQYEKNTTLFPVILIGNALWPNDTVSIGLADLLSHSRWAQKSYSNQDSLDTTQWTEQPPVKVVLPIRTASKVVRKVVAALYSGHLHIGDEAEEMLMLANHLQVSSPCAKRIPI